MHPKQSDALDRVAELVRFLRTHCPWDAAQTPRSLIPYLLEEAHEAADAIAEGDDDALRSELGDLLLNLAFQLVLAEERGAFDREAVADAVTDKMRRRHPHLYGLGEREDWETLKARERAAAAGEEGTAAGEPPAAGESAGDEQTRPGPPSLLHGVARGLDPLSRAHRMQERVAAVGFDWSDYRGAVTKVVEELEEVREELEGRGATQRTTTQRTTTQRTTTTEPTTARRAASAAGAPADAVEGSALEEELGDLLFAVVNLTRLAGANAFTALQRANAKFDRRFRGVEALAAERGLTLDRMGLEALDALWDEVKREERAGSPEDAEST